VEDRRWLLNLQGFQALESVGGGLSDLPDGAVGAQQLSKFYPLQIVFDVAPGIGAGLLGDALSQAK